MKLWAVTLVFLLYYDGQAIAAQKRDIKGVSLGATWQNAATITRESSGPPRIDSVLRPAPPRPAAKPGDPLKCDQSDRGTQLFAGPMISCDVGGGFFHAHYSPYSNKISAIEYYFDTAASEESIVQEIANTYGVTLKTKIQNVFENESSDFGVSLYIRLGGSNPFRLLIYDPRLIQEEIQMQKQQDLNQRPMPKF